jgi:hypothetical protein
MFTCNFLSDMLNCSNNVYNTIFSAFCLYIIQTSCNSKLAGLDVPVVCGRRTRRVCLGCLVAGRLSGPSPPDPQSPAPHSSPVYTNTTIRTCDRFGEHYTAFSPVQEFAMCKLEKSTGGCIFYGSFMYIFLQ